MKLTLDYPPVWLAAAMAGAYGIAQAETVLGNAGLWPGRVLIALGLGLVIWAAVAFRRARTTIIPHETPSALVETGPFRFSRNPIYLADLVILAGWCLALGTIMGLVLILPLAFILQRRFILPEEGRLATHLGPAYTEYRARVRRWI
jgi:protein-S-isoprenylcysteine O-methyltransferase Ste14